MAQRLLKRKPHKVTPGRARTPAAPPPTTGGRMSTHAPGKAVAPRPPCASAVLVGTYKAKQLAWIKRHGIYNYPVKDGDEFDEKSFASIKELWLYADVKGTRHVFEAEFIGIKTREELVDEYSYPASGAFNVETQRRRGGRARPPGAPHGSRYYVFSAKHLDYGSRLDDPFVIARTADFGGRSAKVKKAIEQFKADGEFAPLEHYLPSDLSKVPRNRLRVCEAAMQLEFLHILSGRSTDVAPKADFFMKIKNATVAEALSLNHTDDANGFTHVDCFSGVGGFCTGLHAAGFSTKVAIEKIRSCVETYQANHPDVHVINNDICKVTPEDILPFCPKDGIDLVTSGMPCETFSTAGNTSRSFYDERQFLFREGIRVAKITRAKFLLFENVPAITTKTTEKNSRELIVDVLKGELIKAGYKDFIEVVLDATRFGVPQKRKRYFVLGTRLPHVHLRKPISSLIRSFTVGEAFADLPPVEPNSWVERTEYLPSSNPFTELMRNDRFWRRTKLTTSKLTYQMPMKHRPATLERFGLLRPGEGLRELFERFVGKDREELQSRRVLPKKMFIKRNYRLPAGSPSPCVTSHCLDEFVHPVENRALTVRECARLQSFPDSYDFVGGPYIVPHIDREVQDKYEQIGDAVPPLLAYAWGRVIAEMLKEDAK